MQKEKSEELVKEIEKIVSKFENIYKISNLNLNSEELKLSFNFDNLDLIKKDCLSFFEFIKSLKLEILNVSDFGNDFYIELNNKVDFFDDLKIKADEIWKIVLEIITINEPILYSMIKDINPSFDFSDAKIIFNLNNCDIPRFALGKKLSNKIINTFKGIFNCEIIIVYMNKEISSLNLDSDSSKLSNNLEINSKTEAEVLPPDYIFENSVESIEIENKTGETTYNLNIKTVSNVDLNNEEDKAYFTIESSKNESSDSGDIKDDREEIVKKIRKEAYEAKQKKLSKLQQEENKKMGEKVSVDKTTKIEGRMSEKIGIRTISEITKDTGEVMITGEIYNTDLRKLKDDLYLLTFNIYDGTEAISVKRFLRDGKKKQKPKDVLKAIEGHISDKGLFAVYGTAGFDDYAKEVNVNAFGIAKNGYIVNAVKLDKASEKRVELRAHSKMSQLDGVISIKDLVARTKQYGMKAIGLTDLGVVQSFPDLMFAVKEAGIKPLYGMDAFLTIDDASAISFLKDSSISDSTYCVLDLETTGLSYRTDKIIEFGVAKYKNGKIIDKIECFVNPEVPISEEITNITNITNDMVKDAETIDKVMPKVVEFLGDDILVAHNADFDIGFMKYNAELLGLSLDNMYIDTLRLAKKVYPELKRFRLGKIAEHLGIVVEVAHRAYDDVVTLVKVFEKMMAKIQEKDIHNWQELDANWTEGQENAYQRYSMFNATVFVKKQIGMRNLYKLVSMAHLDHFYVKPRMLKSLYQKYSEGLIIGSGNSSGELYSAIESGKSHEELLEIAEFYDFLEVQPPENESLKITREIFKDYRDAEIIIEKIIELGKELNKPVVATGDVFFLDPEDKIYREILHVGQKKKFARDQANLYYRTTDEMLEAFSFLDEKLAKEIVVTNSNLIADMIDDGIIPIAEDKFAPKIEGGDEMLKKLTYEKAHELYGENLPEIVEKRIEKELNSIISNGFSVMYMIAQKLVQKSNEDGYIVGSRGSVGSSLVAFLSGITEVNSLKAHYRCPNCKYSDFSDTGIMNGFDLPDKECPKCSKMLVKDGLDIPFETFLGFAGNKEPDIDLNFSDEYQSTAHKYTEEIIDGGSTYKAGTIGTIADKTAYGYVKGYFADKEIQKSSAEIERLAKGCTGVKRTTGQHPGGIIVVPAGKEIYDFCPIQRPADKSVDIITTHFDYHKIDHNLLKLDILGHLDPTMIKYLKDMTGIDPVKISLDDKKTMSIFSSTEALGVTPKDINSLVGTFGVPEFGTKFVRGMLLDTKPTTFEELIRISGLSHGTDVWLNNAQTLVNEKIATLSETICTRDDIMIYLMNKGMDPELSFTIMEAVRKGKGLKEDWEAAMRELQVPEWYISSCKKIKYMFPKAHAAAYVTNSFRVAWFKVHKPLAYYAAYFTVRAKEDFDASFMINGVEKLETKMQELKTIKNPSVKEKGVYDVAEIVLEMYKRGIEFLPIDLYKSDSRMFKIEGENKIRPPFSCIPGMGGIASESIANEAKKETFFTKEDLKFRCKIGQSTLELLEKYGVLNGMPDTAQVSFFDGLI